MFQKIGIPELLIILVIVIVLFGPGRIGKIAGELGSGIKAFRDGLGKEDNNQPKPPTNDENNNK